MAPLLPGLTRIKGLYLLQAWSSDWYTIRASTCRMPVNVVLTSLQLHRRDRTSRSMAAASRPTCNLPCSYYRHGQCFCVARASRRSHSFGSPSTSYDVVQCHHARYHSLRPFEELNFVSPSPNCSRHKVPLGKPFLE
ncbi:hypothetical protein ANAPC5_01455 [Anaplasma phagocytophilum]|nr:hypothetical protein ANAPC5_01455 [Anaplasma phagocytophilum]